MDIDKREIIKGSQLFWGLTDSQVDKLVELCQEKSYAPGERIFNVGDKADYLYIVVEGKIALEMALRVGRRTRKQATLDVIEKGEAFGWSAPFSERLPTLNMSAISTEKTSLIYFKGTDLHHLYYDDIDLYCKMIEELIFLVSGRLDKAKKTLAQVLSIASHDLRAPLATVQSCMDVLSGGFVGEINEKQRELIAGSKHRIADLTAMIDNILDISHIEISDMDFESTSLSKIIAGSSGDIQGMADKKQIQLVNDIPEDLPPVLGVPKRLHQVLNNLLSNAVKFTLDGGKVTIRCRATEDSVRVEVSDTGIGIPKEELTKVFDDFYRGVQVDTEGAGIGLGIAKKIVEAHNGRIWAESPDPDTGMGTRFSFYLPKISGAFKAVSVKEVQENTGAKAQKILVADDDPEMLKLTTLILESGGYIVVNAQDGEDALTKIEEENPDLLVLDLLMPKLDGFEVVKRVNERMKGDDRIPVLILSAVRENSSRQRYELEMRESFNIDDYLQKPVSPPVLLQKVERILAKRKFKI